MAGVGSACLVAGLMTALYAAAASIYGAVSGRREFVVSGRRAMYCLAALMIAATAILQAAFLRTDLHYDIVAGGSSTDTPTFYKVTAMWATQEGSLLLWALLGSIFTSLVLFLTRRSLREIAPWAAAVLAVISGFFLFLMVGWENPFVTSAVAPLEGNGLNPLLRHPAMMIHPPMLYTGYVGFSVPFAFAIGALITRNTGADWIRATRRFALIAWLFLGIGVMLGALWSYTELGWGGYWAWDPVENASIMPWLIGTAFIHSIMVQEKRGMLKIWNVSLIIATFVLALLGTFLVRSGILESIHAFGDSTIGNQFLTFIAIVILGSTALVISRLAGSALGGQARLADLARGVLPAQQPRARRPLPGGVLGHVLPAHLRGADRDEGERRAAVVQPRDGAARAGPRRPDGNRPDDSLAQDLAGQAAARALHPLVHRGRDGRCARVPDRRRRERQVADHVRPVRVRRRRGRPGVRARDRGPPDHDQGIVGRGARAPDRSQPAPLRRLHRPRRLRVAAGRRGRVVRVHDPARRSPAPGREHRRQRDHDHVRPPDGAARFRYRRYGCADLLRRGPAGDQRRGDQDAAPAAELLPGERCFEGHDRSVLRG